MFAGRLLAALAGAALTGAGAAPVAPPACPKALAQVGPPDDVRINAIRGYRNWHNPTVIADTDGYLIILDGDGWSHRGLTLSQVRTRLLALPATAWPLGRVVGGTVASIGSGPPEGEFARRYRRLVELRTALERLCVRLDEWTSM